MSRLKTFYTPDEITTNLYTTGSKLMTEDLVEYVGAYHEYITGEQYTNAIWDSKISKKLIPYETYDSTNKQYKLLKPNINVRFETPYASKPVITKTDISNKFVTRFFIKRINDTNILEINQATYQNWSTNKIDKKMYNAVSIEWAIAGNIEDSFNGSVFVPGVLTKNKQSIEAASIRLPELQNAITNFTEYYTDTDFIIPVDINGLDS
jgi:hypothetical protein